MGEQGTGQVKSYLLDEEVEEKQETEITLGTGKLLGIFFALVIVCAVFFTMGYLLGKSASAGGRTEIVGAVPSGGNSAGKPSAVNKTAENPALYSGSTDAQVTPSAATPGNVSSNSSAPADSSPAPAEIKTSPTGSYLVQVAAVSKQEDAEILVSALRKKQYPGFIASAAGDALFHVQVGPFSDAKDADTMRNRLVSDGYNAIVKH